MRPPVAPRAPPIAQSPSLVQKDGRHALLVDGAPFLMLGAQVNNSSAWPAVLPQVWPAIKAIHANTVEMPVYWEQFEPKPGAFDYTVVDTPGRPSRKNGVRLVLLWFGTWKNNGPAYVPLWLKEDPKRFARMLTADGRPIGSISPFSERDAGGGQARLRGADAPPQEDRSSAHGDPGAGRERIGHLGRRP